MKALVNRLSWMLIAFVVASSLLTLVVVAGAGLLVHLSLPWPQTWLLSAGIVVYLLVQERRTPAAPPPAPPPPEPPVPLQDLEHLRHLWVAGDITEATYRRAVAQATRRYVPPPPPPPPSRRRR